MKFQATHSGKDKFDNSTFIVRREKNPTDYKKLLEVKDKINGMITNPLSNPIYANEEYEYIKIRMAGSRTLKFLPSSLYELTTEFRKTENDEKVYINIYGKYKLIKKYEPQGEVITF